MNSDLHDLLAKIITTAQGPHSYNDGNATIHPLFSDRAINDGDVFHSMSNLLPSSTKLHISLSRCIFLKAFQLDRFTELLREALEGRKRYLLRLDANSVGLYFAFSYATFSVLLSSFSLSFARIEHFTNDEGTRSFISLEVGAGHSEVSYFLIGNST